jgi:leucyl aminopeptidase (aminopeptidase T)
MDKIHFGAKQTIDCMKVQPHERVVIIASQITDDISRLVERESRKVTSSVSYFLMEDFGKRPFPLPEEIRQALLQADVGFYTGNYVDGELGLFRKPIYAIVGKTKLRYANMPSLSREILEQGMNADYSALREFTSKVHDILKDAKTIQVRTAIGTDLEAKVGKYRWYVCDGNIKPGQYSNLPDGEVFTSPEDVNGRFVVDGVLGDYFDEKYGATTSTPVTVDIRNCHAIEGSVRCDNPILKKEFEDYVFRKNSPNSNRVGEFALGTNLALKRIIGNTLQDEKFPSIHMAFGDSLEEDTGCPYSCDYHIDGVILKPTVIVDGRPLMVNGKYKI